MRQSRGAEFESGNESCMLEKQGLEIHATEK